jgi:hypothetical protein
VETALRRMADMIDSTVAALRGAFAEGQAVQLFEPGTWPPTLWLLLGALVLLLLAANLRRRARRPLAVRPPEILVTQGELVPEARTGRLGAGMLSMTVSNLGRYPVQLLEAACRTGAGGRFGIAETVALVPAMDEVDISVRMPVARLDDGVLDLYCYAAATRTKIWRHRAELVWEPWAKRFKVAPLEQRIEPARALASERRDVVRMDEVARALETAVREAETATRRTDGGPPSPARSRGVIDARRTAAREAAAADTGAAPRGPDRPGSLIALLGGGRSRPAEPPRTVPPGGLGATARAKRTIATRPVATVAPAPARRRPEPEAEGDGPAAATPRARPARAADVVVGAVRPTPLPPSSEVPPSADRGAPSGGSAAVDQAVPGTAPAGSVPAGPAERRAGTPAASAPPTATDPRGSRASARRSGPRQPAKPAAPPETEPEGEDPDEPRAPRRPRDLSLEFPDEF